MITGIMGLSQKELKECEPHETVYFNGKHAEYT